MNKLIILFALMVMCLSSIAFAVPDCDFYLNVTESGFNAGDVLVTGNITGVIMTTNVTVVQMGNQFALELIGGTENYFIKLDHSVTSGNHTWIIVWSMSTPTYTNCFWDWTWNDQWHTCYGFNYGILNMHYGVADPSWGNLDSDVTYESGRVDKFGLTINVDTDTAIPYVNDAAKGNDVPSGSSYNDYGKVYLFGQGGLGDKYYIYAIYSYNGTYGDGACSPPTLPIISNVNCTSCNIPYGDVTEPYSTYDTTPTIRFETNVNAWCRISDEYENYTIMGESRSCSGGEGTENHTCTLTAQDELIFSTDYVYIVCKGYFELYSNITSLQMEITSLSQNRTRALEQGVMNSVIWPGATIYSNQQVYLRNLQNQQLTATVDKVAVYGNQRWLLHYYNETESPLGLFNITPVVYSLELTNKSTREIEDEVAAFINLTKN